MFDCKLTPIHGGSMIGYVTHKGKKAKTQRYLEACASENAAKRLIKQQLSIIPEWNH
jgi:hypothetical protein